MQAKKRLLLIIAGGILALCVAIPALALVLPESIAVNDARVFRHLAQENDSLYVFERTLSWASDNYPSESPASDSILFRLYDTDNTTLKATATPYVFSFWTGVNGYGKGVDAFYFSASDNAPAWGAEAKINIYGLPAFFDPPQTATYTLTAGDYTSANTQVENREELYNYILLLADRLETNYPDDGITLKTSSDSGIVLSTYGELYFRGAIEGLQNLCPDLFFIQVYIPEMMPVEPYDMSLQTTYTDRLDDTDMERGFDRLGDVLGITGIAVTAGVFFVLVLALCIYCVKKDYGLEAGIGGSSLIGILSALVIGDLLFTLLMVATLLAGIGLVYLIFLNKA